MDIKTLNLSFPGIYQILNLVNGKRYIGQAQNVKKRIYEHRRTKNKGVLPRAIKKYGWGNFEISLLEKVDNVSSLDEREQFWLDLFKSYHKQNGYNICKVAGTTRGRKRPIEEINRIVSNRRSYSGKNNPFFGKKHSKTTKGKIAKAKKKIVITWADKIQATRNKNGTQNPKKPVTQYNIKTGGIVKLWIGVADVSKSGYTLSSISQCCNNKRKSHRGFGWKFTVK